MIGISNLWKHRAPRPSEEQHSVHPTEDAARRKEISSNIGPDPSHFRAAAEPAAPAPRMVASAERQRLADDGPAAALPADARRTAPTRQPSQGFDQSGFHGTPCRPSQASFGKSEVQTATAAAHRPYAEASVAASSSFTRLGKQYFDGGERSIDNLVRELLQPMLEHWLDENLPRVVERLVTEEIKRLARRR